MEMNDPFFDRKIYLQTVLERKQVKKCQLHSFLTNEGEIILHGI